MSPIVFGYAFALATALIVIVGDVALKQAADAQATFTSSQVALGAALYAISAFMWFYAMRHITLAQAGVAYSMLTLIALAVIGAVWFNESLGAREYAGLACALAAMGFMSHLA